MFDFIAASRRKSALLPLQYLKSATVEEIEGDDKVEKHWEGGIGLVWRVVKHGYGFEIGPHRYIWKRDQEKSESSLLF